MHPADFETRLHRGLRDLPPRPAPDTLLPRVMAAVQRWAARPWYERAWFTWPGWAQATSMAVLIAVVAASFFAIPAAAAAARGAIAAVDARLPHGFALQTRVTTAVSIAATLWRAAMPFLGYASIVLFVLTFTCAMCAMALTRVAFGRALTS